MAHILLLEPNTQLGDIFARALRHAGHSISWQQTAQSALNSADNHTPDVLIVELQLALHNGIEFLYEFRSYQEWQHIPVVILSNVLPHQTNQGSVLWNQLGIATYHYKPYTRLRDLTKTLEQLLAPVT